MTTRVRKFLKMWLLILLAFAVAIAFGLMIKEAVTHGHWWVGVVIIVVPLSLFAAWDMSR